MVNGNEPSLTYYLPLIKLNHAIAGIYTWETVFTVGFELDVLRGKQRYRWTIWLYLGIRYTALLVFILTLIGENSVKVSCEPFIIAGSVFIYASWAFASLIIVLRVIAIWNRQRIVSFLSVCVWLAGIGTLLHSLTTVKGFHYPNQDTCFIQGIRKSLSAPVAMLAVDIVLLTNMLIGLLRYAHMSSTGIWHLLYQQCIIWIALAAIAEVPVVVFLILNLNDIWNEMFLHLAVAIVAIGVPRLYRSLCQHGSLMEPVISELPSSGRPISNAQSGAGNVRSSIHFAAATKSSSIDSTSEEPVSIPKGSVQMKFASGASSLWQEDMEDKVGYKLETA